MAESQLKNRCVRTTDLLTVYDRGHKRGFLTRTCYYCFIAMDNQTKAEYSTLKHLRERVLSSSHVCEAIQAAVEESRSEVANVSSDDTLEIEYKQKCEGIAKDMIGTVTSRVIKFCGWMYLVLLKQVCRSVLFSPSQLDAVPDGLPVVYMPLHYSHLDYILVSLVLFHNNIRVPFIASGNNLHLPLIGYFIKRAGGFFIRRKLDESNRKDVIYRSVLQTYVTEILKEGQSVEIFLEGTRSRSGLPNFPKTGLLSILVDAVVDGHVPDILIVPVHTSYEKLFEGNFSNELMGKLKKPENLWDTIKSVMRMLFGHFGGIKINFAKPISLKTALQDICMYSTTKNLAISDASHCHSFNDQLSKDILTRQSSSSLLSSSPDVSWRKNISFLAEHIIFHALNCGSFMSTHLVAFLLVNRWRNGVLLEDLIVSYMRLMAKITSRGRDIGFSGVPHDVVVNALNLLGEKVIALEYVSMDEVVDSLPASPVNLRGAGDASTSISHQEEDRSEDLTDEKADSGIFINCDPANVKSVGGSDFDQNVSKNTQKPTLFVRPIVDVPEIFELLYYSNALTPVFAMESIISLSVTAVTGFRFSMIDEMWKLNNGADIFEDSLPEKMRRSFLRSTLVEKALELCEFLQLDLILCDVIVDVEDCIKDGIHNLTSSGCLISETIGCTRMTNMAYGLDEEENITDDELLRINPLSISQLLSYQSILAPFVEAMSMVTEQLKTLEDPLPRKQFLSRLLEYAHDRAKMGLVTRIECCSSEILSHSIHAFKSNKVLESVDAGITLTKECRGTEYLDNLLTKICQYLM